MVEPLKRQLHEVKLENERLIKKLESRRKYCTTMAEEMGKLKAENTNLRRVQHDTNAFGQGLKAGFVDTDNFTAKFILSPIF